MQVKDDAGADAAVLEVWKIAVLKGKKEEKEEQHRLTDGAGCIATPW